MNSPFLSAGRMRAAIIRSNKSLRINDLYRRMQGEFGYKLRLPWFDNFVIKLTLFAKNEVKIVAMVKPNFFVVALVSRCRSK
jgi:hypothetical protein